MNRQEKAHWASIELLFDEEFYAASVEARREGLSPIDHYLQKGEARGLAPSRHFDPTYYRRQYPDLKSWQQSLLEHYVLHGQAEGRSGRPMTPDIECPTANLDPTRETVLVAVHDATRSGAPILSWNLIYKLSKRYNVVAILKSGGPIEASFHETATAVVKIPGNFPYGSFDDVLLAKKLIAAYAPLYAISNSVATREIAIFLEQAGVPVIALIHEFSSYFQPVGILNPLYVSASKLVFSAQTVADASVQDYPGLKPRQLYIIPQGPSRVPESHDSADEMRLEESPPAISLDSLDLADTAVIVGMGRIEYRKGVDAFISAAAVLRRITRHKFKFLWIGHLDLIDTSYFKFLQEQIKRSELTDQVLFVGQADNLKPFYKRADVLFLSSRLDPLPNVAIDALLRGIPVVCFTNAGGIGDWLASSRDTNALAVPYMNAEAAGRTIRTLIERKHYVRTLGKKLRTRAKTRFNMRTYVRELDRLGRQSTVECRQMIEDQATILESGAFNARLRFGNNAQKFSPEEAVREYLNASRLARPLSRPNSGMLIRRPMEGFHPLIYASDNPHVDRKGIDPFADYLRRGRPKGRWSYPVIRPDRTSDTASHGLRVAIHGHFYYPDLLEDFLKLLSVNKTPVDLFLTTGGTTEAKQIQKILAAAGTRPAEVWVVPNRGRDIGPFLKELPTRLKSYDVVGHFHGKRSKHVESAIGDQWRDFVWQHLVGDLFPMVDVIGDAFASDKQLGLVFPEDPYLNGWDMNRELGEQLARRLRIIDPLPNHFNFPIGTMFWARVQALKPLFRLNIGWDDYPDEPLPIDGTILHTLERIIPFAVDKAGFGYATTYVAQSVRDDWLAFLRRPHLSGSNTS